MSRIRRSFVALILPALALGACGGATATYALESPAAAQEIIAAPPEGLVILDVRTPEEYASGRIADAVNLDFYSPTFKASLEELDRDVPYLVYCRSGNRSAQTVDIMRELGFVEIHELSGGIVEWAASGLPIE